MKPFGARSSGPGSLSDLVEVLSFELRFLEDGGYRRSIRTPWKATSMFQDSPTCLNFDSIRVHPCEECLLMRFVPPERHTESIPCHHIPLNKTGDTVHSLSLQGSQQELEEAVKHWLQTTLDQLEQERDEGNPAPKSG